MTMIKRLSILLVLLQLPSVQSWIVQMVPQFGRTRRLSTQRFAHLQIRPETEIPCWQVLSDDECSMDSTYAASFVASEWLKRMPCADGMEDCDIPDSLKVPGNRNGDIEDTFDVMEYLNLKRADVGGKKKA